MMIDMSIRISLKNNATIRNEMSRPVFKWDLKPITVNIAHSTGMTPPNDNKRF